MPQNNGSAPASVETPAPAISPNPAETPVPAPAAAPVSWAEHVKAVQQQLAAPTPETPVAPAPT